MERAKGGACNMSIILAVVAAVQLSVGLSTSFAQPAKTVQVASNPELMSALANANGGEVILLQPGNYGDLMLHASRQPFLKFSAPVTLRSADLKRMATFTSAKLVGVENLTFEFIKFDYIAKSAADDRLRPFDIVGGSRNIVIANSIFDGDLASNRGDAIDGYGTGFGLTATNATNITVMQNTFYNWARAGIFGSVDNLKIIGNEIFQIRSDGLNFANVNNVMIEKNHIHDFATAPSSNDHPDMIQIWTNGTTKPSTDIVIRGNILNSGRGGWTQSIFMRNELVDTKRAGDEMFYRNITIENNVIYNAHAHGITVGETRGLTIKNNTILRNLAAGDGRLVHVPHIHLRAGSTDVTVANNIVTMVGSLARSLPSLANVAVTNNLVVQRDRAGEPNYYGRLFVNALADSDATLDDLRALPGGMIEQMGVGSRMTRFDERPNSLTGFIVHQPGIALSSLTHSFSARNLFGPQGRINSDGASVSWDFGDGSTAKGIATAHTYTRPGRYLVTADVTLADRRAVRLRRTIAVVPPAAMEKAR